MSAPDDWIAGSANWMTNADWSNGFAPVAANDVYLGTNARTATVTSNTDVIMNTLQIRNGDALDITGGNFEVINGLPFGMFGSSSWRAARSRSTTARSIIPQPSSCRRSQTFLSA